jgi:two-component system, response regulator PdtaR
MAWRSFEEIRPRYVLVVEDEALLRAFIADELRMAGFTVIEAGDADDAWTYLCAGGPVDVLFSDILMPGSMDGLDLARKLKLRAPEVDVIIISGKQTPAKSDAFDAFLAKPFPAERAVAAVLTTMRARRGLIA